jgi:hypothetical protein
VAAAAAARYTALLRNCTGSSAAGLLVTKITVEVGSADETLGRGTDYSHGVRLIAGAALDVTAASPYGVASPGR